MEVEYGKYFGSAYYVNAEKILDNVPIPIYSTISTNWKTIFVTWK